MSTDAIHHPPLMPHLLIDGLNRYNDEPCLFLGEKVATYREVREHTSQMVQALQSKGLGKGNRIAVISANRPEVLSNIAGIIPKIEGKLDPISKIIGHVADSALSQLTEEPPLWQDPGDG